MNDEWTGFEDVLSSLRMETPETGHSRLVREKCHRALRRPPLRRTVESVIVGSFCAAYITVGAFLAVHYRGLL
jgi:hypothetical protein